jgi:hypothetical protein
MRCLQCLEPAPAPAPALEDPDMCDRCFLPENTSDYTKLLWEHGDMTCIRCYFKVGDSRGIATQFARRENIVIERLRGTDLGDPLPYAHDELESIRIFCDIFKGEYGTQAQDVLYEELNSLLKTSPLKLKALLDSVSKYDTDAKAALERTGFLSMAAEAADKEEKRIASIQMSEDVCPITNELVESTNAVTDIYDHTYDENYLKEWLKVKQISPSTREPLSVELLKKGLVNPYVEHFREFKKDKTLKQLEEEVERLDEAAEAVLDRSDPLDVSQGGGYKKKRRLTKKRRKSKKKKKSKKKRKSKRRK